MLPPVKATTIVRSHLRTTQGCRLSEMSQLTPCWQIVLRFSQWSGFSGNGVLTLLLGMATDIPSRHRPPFRVIPLFILGFPTSSTQNFISPCGAVNTSKIKAAPNKYFAFGVTQLPTPHPPPESLLVNLDKASGKCDSCTSLNDHHKSFPRLGLHGSQHNQSNRAIPERSPDGQWSQYDKRHRCRSISVKQQEWHAKRP